MIRDFIKERIRETKRTLRDSVLNFLSDDDEDIEGQKGKIQYTFKGQFIEGADLRSMLSGSTALTALWVNSDESTEYLEKDLLMPGVYQVQVSVDLVYKMIESEINVNVPVHSPKVLIEALETKEDD